MKRYISIIILMGLLLASCGQRPVSGYVVGKHHIKEHNIVRYNPVLQIPEVQHVRERWVVFVGDSCHNAPFDVTQETYERLELGQFVTAKGFE